MFIRVYVFMPTCVQSTLVSMHTYEGDYAYMSVWVHVAGDWSAGNRVWMMGGMVMEAVQAGWGDGVKRSGGRRRTAVHKGYNTGMSNNTVPRAFCTCSATSSSRVGNKVTAA